MILADRRWKVEAASVLVRAILADIGLEVAEAKSGIVAAKDGFEFLGFSFRGRFLRPSPSALARFKDRVQSQTRRQALISLSAMVEDQLNPLLRGWGNYYAMGHVVDLFTNVDGWIRMRLRSKARQRYKCKNSAADHRKWPNSFFDELGLVRLERLARTHRLSPT